MAERVGFEPTEPFGSPVFKTGAIDHSTTSPLSVSAFAMEPLVGFEPTTYSLRMNCSTPELQRRLTDVADRTKAHGDPQGGNLQEIEMRAKSTQRGRYRGW